MPRLSISKRSRLIAIFYQYNLERADKKYDKLVSLAKEEEIFISKQHATKIMIKWLKTKSVSDSNRINGCTKVTNHQLNLLNNAVYHNRDLTAKKLKFIFNLNVSVRSVQRYLNIMGWVKIRTKYCQAVSLKNRKERICFANMAKSFKDEFDNSIFIDESTVQATRNAHRMWHKPYGNETRLGLQETYSHLMSVHVIGGISRKGATELLIFNGKVDIIYELEVKFYFKFKFSLLKVVWTDLHLFICLIDFLSHLKMLNILTAIGYIWTTQLLISVVIPKRFLIKTISIILEPRLSRRT